MNWKILEKAAQQTDMAQPSDPGNRQYQDYLASRTAAWWAEAGVSPTEARALIRWLNQWKTRVSYATAESLASNAGTAASQLAPLRSAVLFDVDLDEEMWRRIRMAFDAYREAVGPTGAAKALHMMNPRLFVMWDDAIRGGYSVREDGIAYADIFLPLMQAEVREAVESFERDGLALDGAGGPGLEARCSAQWTRSLAKIVDEHNYWKFTRRLKAFWRLQPRRLLTKEPT